jgi:hypothetical protein
MSMVQSAQNPQAMIMQMMQTNPNVQKAMDYMKQFSDPKTAFYNLARQKGVNPDDVLNSLK